MQAIDKNLAALLVPVQLAGYVLVLHAVADRATMRARGRVAAAQPLLHQSLHLLIRELVSQLYCRVALHCGENPLLPAHPGCRALHSRIGAVDRMARPLSGSTARRSPPCEAPPQRTGYRDGLDRAGRCRPLDLFAQGIVGIVVV